MCWPPSWCSGWFGGNPFSNIEIDGHGWLSDLGHAALDVAGMVPVVGSVADVANGVWYAAEGDYLDAGLSFAGAIPVIGDAALGARYAIKGAKYAEEGVKGLEALKTGEHLAEDAKAGAKALHGGEDAAKGGRTATKAGSAGADKANELAQARKLAAERAAAQREARAEAAATQRAEATGETEAEKVTKGETCNSFTPGTRVLMADGTTKPIKDVQIGDHVQATDPKTGKTLSRTVTGLVATFGAKDLVDVTVNAPTGGRGGSKAASRPKGSVGQNGHLVATDHHPFWVPGLHRWLDADQLRPGMWLRTSSGTYVQITAVRAFTRLAQHVNNLTVETTHTYYVEAGDTTVLVHNGCGPTRAPAGHVYRGGLYKDLKDPATGLNVPGTEINHMPPNAVNGLSRGDGPAIQMDKADHYATASWGRSRAAIQYRARQQGLINQGRYRDAIQMDIDDIRSKFGSKYDGAINEMLGSLPGG